MPRIVAGTAARTPQDPRRASTWPKRTPLDGIIDWETRAPYLYDWVRAQTRPYPGAFTWLEDDEGRDLERSPGAAGDARPRPGPSSSTRPDGPVVACGEGALLLEEFETRRELEVGTVLG